MQKVKKLIIKILQFIKLFILAILSFIISLFNKSSSKANITTKSFHSKQIDKPKTSNDSSTVSYHEPATRNRLEKEIVIFEITEDDLKQLILEIYCEILEIQEKELSDNQKDFLERVYDKISPILSTEIKNNKITDEKNLKIRIKEMLQEELVYTLNPAKTNDDKESKPVTYNNSSKDKLLSSQKLIVNDTPSLKEYKITDTIKKDNNTRISIAIAKKESSNDLPDNNIVEEKIMKAENKIIKNENMTIPIEIATFTLESEDKKVENKDPIFSQNQALEKVKEKKIRLTENNQQQPNNHQPIIEELDFKKIEKQILLIKNDLDTEAQKEELEDKNYQLLEEKINLLLEQIQRKKMQNLNTDNMVKLNKKEQELISIKENLVKQKSSDILLEEQLLEQELTNKELLELELEIKNLQFENRVDLNEKMLQQAEDLENISLNQAQRIEKELLKKKLKKASLIFEIPFLLSLPFIKNKYFRYFTIGLFINHHLNFCNSILKHKTIMPSQEDLEKINNGYDALDEAITITNKNINYLNELTLSILEKYPEINIDQECLFYLNHLKNSLIKQEEKLSKKKMMIEKYNLKRKKYTRTLFKNNKVA